MLTDTKNLTGVFFHVILCGVKGEEKLTLSEEGMEMIRVVRFTFQRIINGDFQSYVRVIVILILILLMSIVWKSEELSHLINSVYPIAKALYLHAVVIAEFLKNTELIG